MYGVRDFVVFVRRLAREVERARVFEMVVAEPLDLVHRATLSHSSCGPATPRLHALITRATSSQVRLSLDERILVKLRGDRDLRGRLHVRRSAPGPG